MRGSVPLVILIVIVITTTVSLDHAFYKKFHYEEPKTEAVNE